MIISSVSQTIQCMIFTAAFLKKSFRWKWPTPSAEDSLDPSIMPYAGLYLVTQSYLSLGDPADWSPPGSSVDGVGCNALLVGIFPTHGPNPALPHCRRILYHLSHQGNPRILEWVAYPFSRGSSQSRSPSGVSRIAGGFFTSWAAREAPLCCSRRIKY